MEVAGFRRRAVIGPGPKLPRAWCESWPYGYNGAMGNEKMRAKRSAKTETWTVTFTRAWRIEGVVAATIEVAFEKARLLQEGGFGEQPETVLIESYKPVPVRLCENKIPMASGGFSKCSALVKADEACASCASRDRFRKAHHGQLTCNDSFCPACLRPDFATPTTTPLPR